MKLIQNTLTQCTEPFKSDLFGLQSTARILLRVYNRVCCDIYYVQ
jgi:hypothetical protein